MDREDRTVQIQIVALAVVVALVGTAVWYAWRSGPQIPTSVDSEGVIAPGRSTPRVDGGIGEREADPSSSRTGERGAAADSVEAGALISGATVGEGTGEAPAATGSGDVAEASGPAGYARQAPGEASGPGDQSVPGPQGTPALTPVSSATPEIQPTVPSHAVGTPKKGDYGSLRGRVAGRITGNPVVGVNVLCSLAGTAVGTVPSDSHGTFLFEYLLAGMYHVEAVGHAAVADIEVVGGETAETLLLVDDRGSISGRVVDSRGSAVPGAIVRLLRSGEGPFGEAEEASARAGSDGAFILLDAPAGIPIRLRAEQTGYAPAVRGPFVLQGGSPLEGVELVLTAGGTVAGRVTDVAGSAVASARLAARVRGQWGRVDASQLGGSASTDRNGNYQIPSLPLGEWEVEVTATGYALERKQCTISAAHETVTLDFILKPGDLVTGMVVDSARRPLSGVTVRLLGGVVSRQTETDSTGTFQFDSVPEGIYNLAAERSDYSPACQSINTHDDQDLLLVLEDLGTLSMRVVTANDQPVSTYTVTITRRGCPPGMLADSAEYEVRVTAADGAYVNRMAAGSYRLTVQAEGYQNAAKDIVLLPGAAGEPVIVRLRGGLMLPGRVVSAESRRPLEGAYVSWFHGDIPVQTDGVFIPDQLLLNDPMGTVVTDAGGYFLLDGLPPTGITVLCDTEGFAPWLESGISVGFDPQDELSIEMLPGVSVRGSVRYAGLPFPNATVELQPQDALRHVAPQWRADTNAQGEFFMQGLVVPGLYRLVATRQYDGSTLWRGFHVEVPHEDTIFDVVFPSGEISIVLSDAVTGEQIVDGTVRLQSVEIQQESPGMLLEISPFLTLKLTDGAGAFTFMALPPGEYGLEVASPGYETLSRPIVLPSGEHLVEPVLLTPSVTQ